MSIKSDLNYLEETKGIIKNAIINKGQNLTDNTPFRDYASAITNISTGVDTSDATATVRDIVSPTTAYVNGAKLSGTIDDFRNSSNFLGLSVSNITSHDAQGKLTVNLAYPWVSGCPYEDIVINSATLFYSDINFTNLASTIGLTANVIKNGVTILGITGNYEGVMSHSEYSEAENLSEDILGNTNNS